ncbi:MAG: hypothetical protein K2L98_00370, partial [Bacilli bacterium]|nr:hypothetical protein [Bacilli bacterium]
MWRNDVKDFMNGKSVSIDFETIDVDFSIKGADDKITVKLNRPDLIFGGTFLSVPKEYENLDGKMVIHPITSEELPIIITDTKNMHLGVPAHNEEDYKIKNVY